ncbi:MAG: AMP-dependent synthetase [Sulfobacillus acidophilus]|uniref:AMP-dependent synthetase n=1 Tax=Sulfobacillus acidophilus TaxID=53633 RepID=A0A2T2WJT9_9FIRM|nr:MAG: AMP-dependent synthetase [Sulfobacillus acidophilus]
MALGVQRLVDQYGTLPLNPAYVLVGNKPSDLPAAYFRDQETDRMVTYGDLVIESARWAEFLRERGVEPGDRVASYVPKGRALLGLALGIWRLGAVYLPLFTAFGPDAVSYRVDHSAAKLVIATEALAPKLPAVLAGRTVTVEQVMQKEGSLGMDDWVLREPDDPMILMYTSGTTGHPKGVPMPTRVLSTIEAYMRWALDVRPEDRYWNLADPGWAYGLAFALIGPWLIGKANYWLEQPFDPKTAIDWIDHWGITHFAAAPTVYRAIRAQGLALPPTLRALSSAGEPLNPSVSAWAQETVGVPILDHYGQTEAGMPINNHRFLALRRRVKPGSMGQAMPGIRAVIVDDDGNELSPGQEGHLAIDVQHSPLFSFRGYYHNEAATQERFVGQGRYYLTGDEARLDDEGDFFFVSRSDDVILTAGYRVGPFDIESVLTMHPAVAECAVVGVPDSLRGQAIKAFVVLRKGYEPTQALESDLQDLVRDRLAKTEYPRQVAFVEALPKTPSGKVQRFVLREMAMGGESQSS